MYARIRSPWGIAPMGREPLRSAGTVVPQWAALCKAPGRFGLARDLQIVYEAGPCAYALARQLHSHGYACKAIAAAKLARPPGDRIKTHRRDALLLARAARAGELVNVTISSKRIAASQRKLSASQCDLVYVGSLGANFDCWTEAADDCWRLSLQLNSNFN